MPEAMRLYRENIALKAQLDRLGTQLALYETTRGRKPTPLGARAAEVFAYLLTRDDLVFRHYYLASSLRTIQRWATRFQRLGLRAGVGGRPETDPKIVDLVVTLKRENPGWGQRRVKQELARMGIKVSEPTIAKILRDNGFQPFPHRPLSFDRVRSGAKDALWALDFFAVKTSKGVWLQGLLVIDIYTRELLELRAFDGWHVDSRWTIQVFNALLARTKRKPIAVLHDHGSHFAGQYHRGLAVLDIDDELTPVGLPSLDCYADSAIGSLRRELRRACGVPSLSRASASRSRSDRLRRSGDLIGESMHYSGAGPTHAIQRLGGRSDSAPTPKPSGGGIEVAPRIKRPPPRGRP